MKLVSKKSRQWLGPFLGAFILAVAPMKAAASLVISEVYANSPGGGQDSGEEWMEVTNTSLDESIDLNNAVLKRLDGTARAEAWSITLSDAPILAPGASLVLAQESDLGLNLCFAFDAYLLGDQFVLGIQGCNTCPFTADGNWGEEVKFSNSNSFPMGVPESVDASEKDDLDVAWSTAECDLGSGAFGTPGNATAAAGDGGVGVSAHGCLEPDDFLPASACEPGGNSGQADAGPGGGNNNTQVTSSLDGGGQVDTAGNATPNGSVTAGIASGQEVTLQLSATDADHDRISAGLYYAALQNQLAGQEIVAGLSLPADGSVVDYTWDFTAAPAGTYFVFAVFTDSYGAKSYAYADRPVQIGEAEFGDFAFTEPDGINDFSDGSSGVTLSWSILPAVEGVVSLYYDDDAQGFDGTPIVSGLSADPAGPRTYLWIPDEEVANGNYAIYGVLSWGDHQAQAYAPGFVEIQKPDAGCQCSTHEKGPENGVPFGAALLLLLGYGLRVRSSRRPSTHQPLSDCK